MPKIEPQPPLAGADALITLLGFLQDKDAVAARLKELTALRDEINGSVARHGQAEGIPALYEQAQADRQEAQKILQAARAEAAETKKVALAERDTAKAEAVQARAELTTLRRDHAALDSTWNTRAAEREAEIARREATAQLYLEQAQEDRHQAGVLKAEWEDKVARLKGAMA